VDDARVEVRLQPRASRDELGGFRDGVLQARVCAAPVDGAANRALCRLIARGVAVAPSRVEVLRGERGRDKLVRVSGVTQEQLLAALDLEDQ
jgi:uncharacterized protein YggU (UPF0235/DUF167 family)